MAEIRLSKLTKQFSIGLSKLVEFLNEHGIPAEMNPNAKISDEHLPLIEAHFGEDLKLKRDSERVTIRLKEIIEMGSRRKEASDTPQEKTSSPATFNETATAADTEGTNLSAKLTGWEKLEDCHKNNRTVQGKVLRRYLHGLIVDIDGIEAKLPTQNICDSEDGLDGYLGQTLDLKVVRIFNDTKSAIVSHREPKRPVKPHNPEEKFERPVLCYVNWFNDSFGVVTPCFVLNSERLGKINEIFIHFTCFDGDRKDIGNIEEKSLVLVSGIVKQTKKISATLWSKLVPSQDTIHYITPFLGKVNPDSFGSGALTESYTGKFLTAYLSKPENPFIDIFQVTFNGTPRERELLFRWLRVLRKGLDKSIHSEYRQCIDDYLTRDEFYSEDVDLEKITTLAIYGELPLRVIRPEHLKVPYSAVKGFKERIIQEIDKDSSLFEECFKGIFDTLKKELSDQSNALKAESNGEVLPAQRFAFSYSRASSNIAQNNRKELLKSCCSAITAYNTHSVQETLDTHELTLEMLDFYKLCLGISETLDARIGVRDSLETDDAFICSARDSFFEESLINNISIDLLIKGVSSGKMKFKSWDKVNGWDEITPELARYIVDSPSKFPAEDIKTIYGKIKQCGSIHKAYRLLNVIDPVDKDAELTQILTGLKENFVFPYYESLIQQLQEDMLEEEHITDIRMLATEFYLPTQISRIDSIATSKRQNWIKELYDLSSNVPDIIYDAVYASILNHIKLTVRKYASISEQFKAVQDKVMPCPETWSEYANLDTITTGDVDKLFGYSTCRYCNEENKTLIPELKGIKKYKEALYLAQQIGNSTKETVDLEIFNEVPYEVYIKLWLEGIGTQHDEALFVNGLTYCATDSEDIPESIYGIYEKCSLCLDKIEKDFNAEYRNAIIKLALEYLSPSSSRSHFQTYLAIVKYIKSHDSDTNNGVSYSQPYWGYAKPQKIDIDLGDEDTNTDLKVALWFLDIGKKLSFTELKDYIVLFRPCQQQRVLKKVFHLYDKKGLTPNIANIYNLFEAKNELLSKIDDKDHEGLFDLTCRIVLYSLNKFAQTGSFEFEKEIFLDILMQQLTKNAKVKYKVEGFFSRCLGRTKARYKFDNYYGELSQVPGGFSVIFNSKDVDIQQMVAELKNIPGRSYNSATHAWFIPAQEEEQILLFARRYRIKLTFGPNDEFKRNAHLIELYRWDKPLDIVREFCDGVPYGSIQARREIPIIWCGSERCYHPCRPKHPEAEWEEYTMLDFCRILGYNTDGIDQQGEIKKDGRYLMFVSWVNWFNMMLEHLYCRECGLILSPDKISKVGRYGVTEFSCRNDECEKFRHSIYLNTCLNRHCRSVIDSRDCKQCPNDWYICPTCGSCCSNDMINRRYHALVTHNQTVNQSLRIAYEQQSGHQDSGKVFCFLCGHETELHDGKYYCKHCRRFVPYRNRLTPKRTV